MVTNGCWQRALTPDSRCAHTDNGLAPTPMWDVHCVTTHPRLRGEHLGWSHWRALSTALSQLSITSGGHHPLTTAANSTNSTNNTAQDWLQDLKCLNIGLVGIICELVPSASVDLNNYLQIPKYSPWNKSQYKCWGGTWEADSIICSRQIILF